jgi:hypothetical protein
VTTAAAYDGALGSALAHLRERIAAAYPSAVFRVTAGVDDPAEAWLVAEVDIDEPMDVLDLVGDEVLAYQVESGLPVYVLPLHSS